MTDPGKSVQKVSDDFMQGVDTLKDSLNSILVSLKKLGRALNSLQLLRQQVSSGDIAPAEVEKLLKRQENLQKNTEGEIDALNKMKVQQKPESNISEENKEMLRNKQDKIERLRNDAKQLKSEEEKYELDNPITRTMIHPDWRMDNRHYPAASKIAENFDSVVNPILIKNDRASQEYHRQGPDISSPRPS